MRNRLRDFGILFRGKVFRAVRFQNFPRAIPGAVVQASLAPSSCQVSRFVAIRERRVKVIPFHRCISVRTAQKNVRHPVTEWQMASKPRFSSVTSIPRRAPIGMRVHFVVQHEGLEAAAPSKGRRHARAFVDQIAAGQSSRKGGHSFFSTVLRHQLPWASVIEAATPEGNPSQLMIWAEAAFRIAVSPTATGKMPPVPKIDNEWPVGKHHRKSRVGWC